MIINKAIEKQRVSGMISVSSKHFLSQDCTEEEFTKLKINFSHMRSHISGSIA